MKNLSAEMTRYGVKNSDLANLLSCSEKAVQNKIAGITNFWIPEAMIIRDTFFPGMRLEYLFAADDPPGFEQKAG